MQLDGVVDGMGPHHQCIAVFGGHALHKPGCVQGGAHRFSFSRGFHHRQAHGMEDSCNLLAEGLEVAVSSIALVVPSAVWVPVPESGTRSTSLRASDSSNYGGVVVAVPDAGTRLKL